MESMTCVKNEIRFIQPEEEKAKGWIPSVHGSTPP